MRTDYTANDASKLSGATLSQIQNLVRTETVYPEREAVRRGVSRLYSLRNVAEISVAVHLIAYGVPVRRVRQIIDSLRRGWPDLSGGGWSGWREIQPTLVLSPPFADDAIWKRAAEIPEWLRERHGCIVVNLGAILDRLEKETGDVFLDLDLCRSTATL